MRVRVVSLGMDKQGNRNSITRPTEETKMNMQIVETQKEKEAREMATCIACGNAKSEGALVCWNCFKYVPQPLKYWNGSFESWLTSSNLSEAKIYDVKCDECKKVIRTSQDIRESFKGGTCFPCFSGRGR